MIKANHHLPAYFASEEKMKLLKNMMMGLGCLAALTIAALLFGPQSARAVTAVLVQVSNTAAAPAITQDVSKLANQTAQFWCPFSYIGCFGFPGTSPTYSVPSSKTLMVTAVDFVWEGSTAPTSNFYDLFCGATLTGNNSVGEWYLAGGVAPTQFTYPSGFPMPAGCAVNMSSSKTTNYDIVVRGYLTAN
jgi:hypothetical protein